MLRLARRDATRSRGRSLLVLVMIALPVLGVTAADIVISTATVSGAESLERRLGAADARVEFEGYRSVEHGPDPDNAMSMSGRSREAVTLATVEAALGRPVDGIERREGGVRVTTDEGVTQAEGTEIDLRDPLAGGLFQLTDGQWPQAPGEVVVNADLAAAGPGIGETITVGDDLSAMVVGIAESASFTGHPQIAGPLGTLGLKSAPGTATFLIVAEGGVSWKDVRVLNTEGAAVLSRAVVTDPPPEATLVMDYSGSDDALLAVLALIVVMALLEVVLLAGPAFAVGARRQSRNLALVAACGGTPKQMRRVVLAGAVVLGSVAAVAGVLGGIAVAYASLPLVQRFDGSRFGPFDVPWLHLVGIAGFGLLSAILAALVPAVLAARQDVVKVLAGRRGDTRPSVRSPLLGLLLLGIGVAGSVYGTRRSEVYIAASAIPAVLGMVLLVAAIVAVLARVSRWMPFALRYSIRDAARHRTRTVPAVAAVAATVVGVVALGIGAASDELERAATYQPALAAEHGAVTSPTMGADWSAAEQAARRVFPAEKIRSVTGVPEGPETAGAPWMLDFTVRGDAYPLLSGYRAMLGASVLVSAEAIPPSMLELDEAQEAAAARVLADGGAVVMTDRPLTAAEVTVRTEYPSRRANSAKSGTVTVPAVFVEIPGSDASLQAVIAPTVAEQLNLTPRVVGLALTGPMSGQEERDVQESVNAVVTQASVYVERGYQRDASATVALVVLGALGALLMLGGTLTATFLALADARPDLATLAAVGARPRSRRAIAAGHAATISLTGAVLGAVVGFVPGIAVTYPLTGVTWTDVDAQGAPLPDHFLDVPWALVLSVVVVLPLLAALIVALAARSRLPMTARAE